MENNAYWNVLLEISPLVKKLLWRLIKHLIWVFWAFAQMHFHHHFLVIWSSCSDLKQLQWGFFFFFASCISRGKWLCVRPAVRNFPSDYFMYVGLLFQGERGREKSMNTHTLSPFSFSLSLKSFLFPFKNIKDQINIFFVKIRKCKFLYMHKTKPKTVFYFSTVDGEEWKAREGDNGGREGENGKTNGAYLGF